MAVYHLYIESTSIGAPSLWPHSMLLVFHISIVCISCSRDHGCLFCPARSDTVPILMTPEEGGGVGRHLPSKFCTSTSFPELKLI